VKQVGDRIWLVTFMRYDLGYFDDETCRLCESDGQTNKPRRLTLIGLLIDGVVDIVMTWWLWVPDPSLKPDRR
jgi:hypothetical protein